MVTVINGTINVDTIIGDLLTAEHIYGFAGNDKIYAGKDDIAYGGLGKDILTASAYGATLVGGKDDDVLYGVQTALAGNDLTTNLFGGVGNDIIYGGYGYNTHIYGGHGADKIYGGLDGYAFLHFDVINEKGILATTAITVDLAAGTSSEGDTIANINNVVTTHFADTVTGNANSNFIKLGAGDDVAYGGGGNDQVSGGDGNDLIYGGDGDDYYTFAVGGLFGGAGNDKIYGDGGNDKIGGDEGNDTLYGGEGWDNIKDGVGDDLIFGGLSNDYLELGDGNDIAYGGGGNDLFSDSEGNDVLYGDDGDDVLGTTNGPFFATGFDTLYGGTGNDELYVYNKSTVSYGGDGIDSLYVLIETDNITINLTTMTNSLGLSFTGIENITVTGVMDFPLSHTALTGDSLSNILTTNMGNDAINGMGGDDTLLGGYGTNTFTGGSGADRFMFNWDYGTGTDTIVDFSTTSGDVIVIERFNSDYRTDFMNEDEYTPVDYTYILNHSAQVGNNVVIHGSEDDAVNITLLNVQLSALSANDFLFID